MFDYSRQIIYIDLMEAGEKKKNAGFLKLEETGQEIRWQMQIKGLYETDTGFYDLRDETGAMVDKILLKQGAGIYRREFDRNGTSRGGRDFGQICGIRIALTGGRALEGRWRISNVALLEDRTEKALSPRKASSLMKAVDKFADTEKIGDSISAAERGMERSMAEAEAEAEAEVKAKAERKAKAEPETEAEEETKAEAKMRAEAEAETEAETKVNAETEPPEKTASETRKRRPDCRNCSRMAANPGRMEVQEKYFENKWEQLQNIYPVVHPFADDREYLSITPRDFVVLGREYQKLVHNSFLLHGYYNYRHVILGKFGEEEDEKYYLGVPGVFYEREKMAAEMFGFEAFEGKETPAESGSFGYYMKQVRI